MKNLIIGLILGGLVTFAGVKLLQSEPAQSQPEAIQKQVMPEVTNEGKSPEATSSEQPLELRDVRKKFITSVASDTDIENLSADELKDLVRNYQTQVAGLADTVKAQKEAIEKLNDERERSPLDEPNLSSEQASAALTNIREAIKTADPEYKEVLESALNLFQNEELVTPSNDALLRHYSEETRVQWATSAQAWLQAYFQNGIDPDANLIQLNCRATYCELYGFYGADNTINDYRIPAAKISNYFREMSAASGYATLFRNAENISLNTSSDNTFMTFHVFIRSVN